ncbi:MAG: PqqD family protein [Clostridiales bacterium]|nr:PqqD family protein [Clostridiales bacterium]
MNSTKNYLDYIPVCAPDHHFFIDKNGIIIICEEHKGFYAWIAQKLYKRPRFSKIKLDELGSFIWKQMDGKRTIYEISFLVKEQFGDKAEPLLPRLTQYFQLLYRNHFIDYVHERFI